MLLPESEFKAFSRGISPEIYEFLKAKRRRVGEEWVTHSGKHAKKVSEDKILYTDPPKTAPTNPFTGAEIVTKKESFLSDKLSNRGRPKLAITKATEAANKFFHSEKPQFRAKLAASLNSLHTGAPDAEMHMKFLTPGAWGFPHYAKTFKQALESVLGWTLPKTHPAMETRLRGWIFDRRADQSKLPDSVKSAAKKHGPKDEADHIKSYVESQTEKGGVYGMRNHILSALSGKMTPGEFSDMFHSGNPVSMSIFMNAYMRFVSKTRSHGGAPKTNAQKKAWYQANVLDALSAKKPKKTVAEISAAGNAAIKKLGIGKMTMSNVLRDSSGPQTDMPIR